LCPEATKKSAKAAKAAEAAEAVKSEKAEKFDAMLEELGIQALLSKGSSKNR